MADLDAYFARIGYGGPRTPELSTLRALHELHPAAIPFEAIDVLLDRGVDLAPEAVAAKLILPVEPSWRPLFDRALQMGGA